MASSGKSSSAGKGKPPGFSEAAQADFEGAPLSSDIGAWADEISQEAKSDEVTRGKNQEAGKQEKTNKSSKKKKPLKHQTVGSKNSGSGTSIGGSNDVKTRVAAGLNPVSGLNVSAEDALKMETTSGVTATVSALSDLIEHGREVMKGDIWIPHRPDRPDKSEGEFHSKW